MVQLLRRLVSKTEITFGMKFVELFTKYNKLLEQNYLGDNHQKLDPQELFIRKCNYRFYAKFQNSLTCLFLLKIKMKVITRNILE